MFTTSPISPVNHQAGRAMRERIDHLTKPLGSLGRIEELAVRLAAIHGGAPPAPYERRAILLGAGDHGVVVEGVSAYPSEVTPQMIGAFLAGFAAINAFARVANAQVFVADFGVASKLPEHPQLIDVAIARGTRNLMREDAMSAEQCEAALDAGARAFERVRRDADPQLLALGEMGIANTTSAAALICALCDATPQNVVGRGTGIDDATLARKRAVVRDALARVHGRSWSEMIAALGGFEIVGLAGVMLAAAAARIPILLDGFIVSAAALIAQRFAPESVGYMIAAHRSHELGHALALQHLGLAPLLDLDLRLGEGSGAALAFPLCEAAARMVCEMKTFEEAGVATAH